MEYIKQFITIVEQGTLTKAAEELHVSQSTLTRNMYSLEIILSVKLFDRGPNHIDLTTIGIFAITKFKEILNIHQEIVKDIKDYDTNKTIINGLSCAHGAIWKMKEIYNQLNPNVRLNVKLFDQNKYIEYLENSDMDFQIITFLIYKKGIETQYFFREQLYLSVFEDHIFYKKEQI